MNLGRNGAGDDGQSTIRPVIRPAITARVKRTVTVISTVFPTRPLMAEHSNIASVVTWLDQWVHTFNFTRVGTDQSLGRDVAMKVAAQIAQRGTAEQRGATDAWPPNAPEYAALKQKQYGHREVNVRTGQMLSVTSLYGRTQIEPELITMIYGTNTPPSSGGGVRTVLPSDTKVTDTQKAEWAHTRSAARDEQGRFASGGRPKRPFFELDQNITSSIIEICQASLSSLVIETNR